MRYHTIIETLIGVYLLAQVTDCTNLDKRELDKLGDRQAKRIHHGTYNHNVHVHRSREKKHPTDLRQNQANEQDIDRVEWWKKTTFYHIYVRSFRDSDNDGNGDLRGVVEKLDYLKMLGVGTILMSPVYDSPMLDGGYDVTNHTAINPMFGNMTDFDDLLRGLKQRDMRIVMDFIPNHVSTSHYWFQCSERAHVEPEKCGMYRDYFIWTNSTRYQGKYPSNWISVFGGKPAWPRSELRNEFYLAQFLPTQADLNLTNPMVREELKNIARFWLRKGVDGLRVDAMPFLLEDTTTWRDEPSNPEWTGEDPYYRLAHTSTFNLKGTSEIIRDWYLLAKNEFDGDRFIVNEAYIPVDDLVKSYGSSHKHRYTDANFAFFMLFMTPEGLNPQKILNHTMHWYNATRSLGWPNDRGTITPWTVWNLDNHDRSRRMNFLGEEKLDWFVWIGFMMPGSPNVYYGNEIGTQNANIEDIPIRTKQQGETSRLINRALMAWNPDELSGGFSNRSDNWMSLPRNYKTYNVKTQLESADKHNHLKNFMAIQNLKDSRMQTFLFGDLVIYRNGRVIDENSNHVEANEPGMIYTLARVHDKYGSLLLVINLNNSTCEKLNLLNDGDKPAPPRVARVQLVNYERNEDQDRLCGSLSSNRLIQGTNNVNLTHLSIGPSQAAIFAY